MDLPSFHLMAHTRTRAIADCMVQVSARMVLRRGGVVLVEEVSGGGAQGVVRMVGAVLQHGAERCPVAALPDEHTDGSVE